MATGLYRDQGIVLRSTRLGEADRVLSVLTQSHGRIRVVAKGVRKTKSRFGARLDAFTHVDLLMYKGRELDIVTQAEIVSRFPSLRQDYERFTAAAAMADAADRMTAERERNVRMFVLLRGGLFALDQGARIPALLAHSFLAKAAALAGLQPALDACVICGRTGVAAFSLSGGGAVCRTCARPSDPRASRSTLALWSEVIAGEWDELRRLEPDPASYRAFAGLLLGFVQWQIEHRFRSFGLIDAPKTGPVAGGAGPSTTAAAVLF